MSKIEFPPDRDEVLAPDPNYKPAGQGFNHLPMFSVAGRKDGEPLAAVTASYGVCHVEVTAHIFPRRCCGKKE